MKSHAVKINLTKFYFRENKVLDSKATGSKSQYFDLFYFMQNCNPLGYDFVWNFCWAKSDEVDL